MGQNQDLKAVVGEGRAVVAEKGVHQVILVGYKFVILTLRLRHLGGKSQSSLKVLA